MSNYQDLIVASEGGVATNRPKILKAMRAESASPNSASTCVDAGVDAAAEQAAWHSAD
jgi:hypothetical protein